MAYWLRPAGGWLGALEAVGYLGHPGSCKTRLVGRALARRDCGASSVRRAARPIPRNVSETLTLLIRLVTPRTIQRGGVYGIRAWFAS
jgi:hypothetical protein